MGREFPWFPQDGKFPKLGKFPNLGNFPGIPVREIPGREKFEAIREGGNGNFPLNIPAPVTPQGRPALYGVSRGQGQTHR